MARVKQFANDLGISKNQAQNLINKGRSRKDGGSQILESVMKKPVYAKNGKSMAMPKRKPNRMYSNDPESAKKTSVQKLKTMGVLERKDKTGKDKTKIINEDFSKKVMETNKKNKKTIKKAGGGATDFGMLSVKAGIDKNPKATQADRIAGAKMKEKPVTRAKGGGIAIQGLGFKGVR
jgi:hypothetical protein